jgi:hypothetical protein
VFQNPFHVYILDMVLTVKPCDVCYWAGFPAKSGDLSKVEHE